MPRRRSLVERVGVGLVMWLDDMFAEKQKTVYRGLTRHTVLERGENCFSKIWSSWQRKGLFFRSHNCNKYHTDEADHWFARLRRNPQFILCLFFVRDQSPVGVCVEVLGVQECLYAGVEGDGTGRGEVEGAFIGDDGD